MKEARAIKLKDIGIDDIRCRKSVTGGMVIEIPGKENYNKAEKLEEKLKNMFQNRQDVRVNRPIKRSEMRIRDLDDSITPQEVIKAIAQSGECREEDVTIGDIKHRTPRSMGVVWVKCPTTAVRKITQAGKITIEWSTARVEVLPTRPLQCFRCLQTGHVKINAKVRQTVVGDAIIAGKEGILQKDATLNLNVLSVPT